ncbi:hypothetical protein JTE90_001147 [Oedothorax gibbosus]|uniref:Uncharacterized protein n=1 Tax=Oedothorax gibbosus TaxID=931172 RepID=A0AAV6VIF8_9ARAC|nr:hypothetical protein JTE90_001147 [Oedothorax gibbosus]
MIVRAIALPHQSAEAFPSSNPAQDFSTLATTNVSNPGYTPSSSAHPTSSPGIAFLSFQQHRAKKETLTLNQLLNI